MKLASFPLARAIIAKPLLRKAYTRDAYAPLLYRGTDWRAQATSLARRQNLISKSHSRALPRRFNSRPPVQLAIILDSSDSAGLRRVAKEWDGRLARQRVEQKRRARRPSHSFSPQGSPAAGSLPTANEQRFTVVEPIRSQVWSWPNLSLFLSVPDLRGLRFMLNASDQNV